MIAKPLGVGTKLGYGLGFGAIGVMLYNLFMLFFMIFMTDVAGVSPIFAGTISFVAVLWDAITDPAVGYISDNTRSRYGRRRPYMLAGLVIVCVCSVLLFTTVDFGQTAKNIYYLVFAMLFWLGFTLFDIPYNTLATDLSDDPEERTRLRYYGMLFFVVCLVFLTSFVWPAISFFQKNLGLSVGKCWQLTVSIVALVAFVLSLTCWFSTRGREKINSELQGGNPLNSLKEILKLKSFRWLLIFSFILGISQIMVQSSVIHVMIYKSGFDQGKLTFVLTTGVIINLLWTGVAAVFGKRLSNYMIYLISVIVSGLGMLLIPNLMDMSNLAVFVVFFGFFGFSAFCLWVYGYVFAYEIGDLSELINNQRHDGILVAYLSFVLKMGGAVGMWTIGVVLEFYGYIPNAPEQSISTIKGMTYLISVFPFALHVLAFVFLLKYPLKKERYKRVLSLLECKRAGQNISDEIIKSLN